MKCPQCKKKVPEGLQYCTNCGYEFKYYYDDLSQVQHGRQARSQRDWLLYMLLALALLVLIATTIYVLNGGRASSSGESTTRETTETTQPATPTPTPTPTSTPSPSNTPTPTDNTKDDEYLLPESNVRKMTDQDLDSLTHEQLCFARNEIYARHGRQFDTPEVANFFASKSWYQGTVPASSFRESDLSDIERANVNIIYDYEKKHYGGSYY